jgi:uncharacterized protein (DUF169 family)
VELHLATESRRGNNEEDPNTLWWIIGKEGGAMSDYQKLAAELMNSLELSLPPIAISFGDVAPANVPSYSGVVPAGCVFWQEAARGTFVTSTKDHELCAIGVHTHHLSEPSKPHQTELQETLQAMSGLDYVRNEEVAAIPVIKREVRHVVYGPLAESPVVPNVVLLFTNAQQGLIISEAVARVDKGAPPALGRPACAVVACAFNEGRAAISLGCCGARAYLDALPESVSLWALPGSKLEQYCAEITVLARANTTLTTFHKRRREDIESGKRPSVRQSLERLPS